MFEYKQAKVEMVEMATMAYQAPLARMERMAEMAGMVKMERLERGGSLASKAHLDLPAQAVEGWSTLAGDEQPALTLQQQSLSTQEGLGELCVLYKEEEPTTFACQRVQTICDTYLECKAVVQSGELSTSLMEVLLIQFTIMTYLAQCVLPLLERWW